jgi:GNAT superfamily N-acetyltransferase
VPLARGKHHRIYGKDVWGAIGTWGARPSERQAARRCPAGVHAEGGCRQAGATPANTPMAATALRCSRRAALGATRHGLAMNSPPITLRSADIEDLAFARQIYFETMRYITDQLPDFDAAQHAARFAERFLPQEVCIIVRGGKDIGWLQVQEANTEIFLKQIFLEPTAQGQGIGSRLLLDLADRARRANKPLRLGVVKLNPAVRLYQRHGFAITGEDAFKYYMEKAPI